MADKRQDNRMGGDCAGEGAFLSLPGVVANPTFLGGRGNGDPASQIYDAVSNTAVISYGLAVDAFTTDSPTRVAIVILVECQDHETQKMGLWYIHRGGCKWFPQRRQSRRNGYIVRTGFLSSSQNTNRGSRMPVYFGGFPKKRKRTAGGGGSEGHTRSVVITMENTNAMGDYCQSHRNGNPCAPTPTQSRGRIKWRVGLGQIKTVLGWTALSLPVAMSPEPWNTTIGIWNGEPGIRIVTDETLEAAICHGRKTSADSPLNLES
ncbi:hypothetical protein J3A83DRAFT_4185767 [Scleroderma citrinum]